MKSDLTKVMTSVILQQCFSFFIVLVPLVILSVYHMFSAGTFDTEPVLGLFSNSSTASIIMQMSIYIFSLFIPFLLYFVFTKSKPTDIMTFKIKHKLNSFLAVFICIGVAIISNIGLVILNTVLTEFNLPIPEAPEMSTPTGIIPTILYYVQIAILPAFLEEFAYRGVVQGALKKYSAPVALFVSAFLFALMHGNMMQIIFAFPLGLAIGYFVLKFDSIWIGILAHFFNNALACTQQLAVYKLGEKLGGIFILGSYLVLMLAALLCIAILAIRMFHQKNKIQIPKGILSNQKALGAVLSSPLMYGYIGMIIALIISYTLAN